MKINPLTLVDFYKTNHYKMYPEDTVLIFDNFTPRKSRIPGVDYTIFFALQYFIKEYLIKQWQRDFFDKPVDEVIKRYKRRCDTSLGPDIVDMDHIAELHRLQYLPLRIMALPEGSKVPIKVPPMIMWNTHPSAFWLPNYLETILSCSIWQACISATYAKEYKKQFEEYAKLSGGSIPFTSFQGHDFSFRGMSSLESACLSGSGHLLSFLGTDTIPAIDFLEEYYNADCEKEIIGMSVPASEHSVMCMGGKEDEIGTIRRLMKVYPKGILSLVLDTWDLWKVLTSYLVTLKDEIMARDGKLVIRPDSGNPADIICGKSLNIGQRSYFKDGIPIDETLMKIPDTPADRGVVELLWDVFGGTVNAKGFKELDPHIGCIYGDSITLAVSNDINQRLMQKGFATTNWVAGIGSYTYQYNTRDTQGWAMKATYGEVAVLSDYEYTGKANGTPIYKTDCREIWKDPITDDGMKKSAKGLIAVYETAKGYEMKDQATWAEVNNCSLRPVFENGKLLIDQSLYQIRERVKY